MLYRAIPLQSTKLDSQHSAQWLKGHTQNNQKFHFLLPAKVYGLPLILNPSSKLNTLTI